MFLQTADCFETKILCESDNLADLLEFMKENSLTPTFVEVVENQDVWSDEKLTSLLELYTQEEQSADVSSWQW